MTIYQNLKKDHDELKLLLQQLVECSEKDGDTEQLLEEIEHALVPHSRAEEAIFYNTLREESNGPKMQIVDSFREHAQAETLLHTLKGLGSIGVEWTRASNQLKESLEHHISEEESELFARAKEIFSDEEARQLGDVFEKTKNEFRDQGTLKNAAQLLTNMLPKRFADRITQTLHKGL